MLNEDKIIAIFCLIDDMLKGIGHKEHPGCKVSDSEIITTSFVAALYFKGHLDNARVFMKMTKLSPAMIDKSRFNRRLHRVAELISTLFFQIGHYLKMLAGAADYIVDSFPVSVCHNMRISSCKLLKGKEFRGYTASMRQYFYGVKVQVLTTDQGVPVEFCFMPGSVHDVCALYELPLQVAPESNIFGDAAYTNYEVEDMMMDASGIQLMIQRKSNSKRPDQPWINFLKLHMRKRIETTFSTIKNLFPKKIHAVTKAGFLIKILLFVTAAAFEMIVP
jgi:Transposase DDE domain